MKDNQTLTEQREMYKKNLEAFEQELDRIVKNFQYQVVLYDESE
jgi:hypothetical protein